MNKRRCAIGKPKTVQTTQNTNTQQQQQQSQDQYGAFDTTNELGFADVPETPAFRALRDWNPTADSSIPFRFGAQRARVMNAYGNLGQSGSPELNTQRQLSALNSLGQEEGAAQAADYGRQSNERYNQLNALTGYSQPVSYNKRTSGTTAETSTGQSSGSGSQNTVGTQPVQGGGSGLLNSLIGGGATVAAAF